MTDLIALEHALRMPRMVYDPEETGVEEVMLFVPVPLVLHGGVLRNEVEMLKLGYGGKAN